MFTTFILPSFYYNFSPKNFSKGATNKINILLRKFSAVAWNCMSKAVGPVTPDIKKVLEHRFNSFKWRAFNRQMIDLYDNKRDLVPKDVQLAKWNGLNRYSVPSQLFESLAKKPKSKFIFPFSDENMDELHSIIHKKQLLIISKIQNKKH